MTQKKNKSAVDSSVRNPAVLSDACNPELVIGAKFDGMFEMPIIKKPAKLLFQINLFRSVIWTGLILKVLPSAHMKMIKNLEIY